jgi:Fe2+ transport system protein FeoA
MLITEELDPLLSLYTNMPQTEQQVIPLSTLAKGEHATIDTLPGGRSISNRLVSLGFTPGVEVDMVQNYRHGPLIVALRGTRVALGRGEAGKILVRRETR